MHAAPIDPVSRATVEALAAPGDGPRVTLSMPTHKAGAQGLREDGIRFKNLVDRAEGLLKDRGVTGLRLQHSLAPLHALQSDETFWRHQSGGLAVFLTPPPESDPKTEAACRSFRLPTAAPEQVTIGDRFEVLPLVPLATGTGIFYVLAVSQNHVRLLEGTRADLRELHPDGLPDNLKEALNVDEYQTYLGLRGEKVSGAGGDVGGRAIYHGHGAADGSVVKAQELTEYFRVIGKALEEFFRDPTPRPDTSEPVPPGTYNPPVVFAGVDYLFPMLKEAWEYKNLLPEAISGNVDALPAADLHAKAWPLAEEFFRAPAAKERERFLETKDSSVRSTDLKEILEAAQIGRVETLFVADGERVTGTLGGAEDVPPTAPGPAPGNADDVGINLLSVAAGETLSNSGRVFVLSRDEMPENATVAATFRYPLRDPTADGTDPATLAGTRAG